MPAAAFHQKKNPRILPPRCFRRASSWSMIPPDVVSTRNLYIQHTSIYNLLLHRYTLHDNFTAGMYTTRAQQMPIGVTSTDPSYLPKFTEGNKLLPQYGSVAEWRDDMPPRMTVRLAADLHPSMDGCAVHIWLS